MIRFWAIVFVSVIAVAHPSAAKAQKFVHIDRDTVTVCASDSPAPLAFTGPACQQVPARRIDPQHRHIWIKATLEVRPGFLETPGPKGLLIMAKAASDAYLNGHFVGSNGTPAATADQEIPGKMDIVHYVPEGLITPGRNDLVLRMSGHHSIIDLSHPVHILALGPYERPQKDMLNWYLPTFLPLGILIAGALYFGFLALQQRQKAATYLVPLISLFAAGQLISEALRGLVAYSYPVQDIRLILVLFFASATGFCLLLHVADRFAGPLKALVTAMVTILTAVLVALAPGFDGKTHVAILTPAIAGALLSLSAVRRKAPLAGGYAAALFAFSAALYILPKLVIDIYLYYVIAALLLFLFAGQVRAYTAARQEQALLAARAQRLEAALAEAGQKKAPKPLSVKDKGTLTPVSTDTIIFCKGARDYVELVVEDGRTLLHSATLSELEKELPGTFLRVHRSFIVNTALVEQLNREPSGSGTLMLAGGHAVPVSRRIMPSVRKALI